MPFYICITAGIHALILSSVHVFQLFKLFNIAKDSPLYAFITTNKKNPPHIWASCSALRRLATQRKRLSRALEKAGAKDFAKRLEIHLDVSHFLFDDHSSHAAHRRRSASATPFHVMLTRAIRSHDGAQRIPRPSKCTIHRSWIVAMATTSLSLLLLNGCRT